MAESESPETGARGKSEGGQRQLTAPYHIISDIDISDPSVTTSQNYLPELEYEDGESTIHDPRWPDDQVGGHTQERPESLQVTTVPVTGNVEDMIVNIEDHARSVSTDTECLLERALRETAQSRELDKYNLAILS